MSLGEVCLPRIVVRHLVNLVNTMPRSHAADRASGTTRAPPAPLPATHRERGGQCVRRRRTAPRRLSETRCCCCCCRSDRWNERRRTAALSLDVPMMMTMVVWERCDCFCYDGAAGGLKFAPIELACFRWRVQKPRHSVPRGILLRIPQMPRTPPAAAAAAYGSRAVHSSWPWYGDRL